jgi:hypothetical protein
MTRRQVAAVFLTRGEINELLACTETFEATPFSKLGTAITKLEGGRARLTRRPTPGAWLCECGAYLPSERGSQPEVAVQLEHNLTERHQEWLRFMGVNTTIYRKDH